MCTKPILLVAAALASCALAVGSARAGGVEAEIATNRPSGLTAKVKHETGPGQFPTDRTLVTFGYCQFAFELPAGFRMDNSEPGRVSLVSQDLGCVISFRVVGAFATEATSLAAAPYREFVAGQFPGAKVLEEFSMSADNRTGPAFEFEWGGGGMFQRCRLAYVPSRGGVLEFRVSASPANFPVARQKFNTVVLSFRATDENGRLNTPRISDSL